jgi:hypothetical protein
MERRVSGNNKGLFVMSQRGVKRGRCLPFQLHSFCTSSILLSAKKKMAETFGYNLYVGILNVPA